LLLQTASHEQRRKICKYLPSKMKVRNPGANKGDVTEIDNNHKKQKVVLDYFTIYFWATAFFILFAIIPFSFSESDKRKKQTAAIGISTTKGLSKAPFLENTFKYTVFFKTAGIELYHSGAAATVRFESSIRRRRC